MNEILNKFRIASRELFNNYFRIDNPYENDGWELLERFEVVERVLFNTLVRLENVGDMEAYGKENRKIVVVPVSSTRTPIMINREIDCGYWDHPMEYTPPEARFSFISFFDWDKLSYKDNRYALVVIASWPEHNELIGKQALIETQYINYKNA